MESRRERMPDPDPAPISINIGLVQNNTGVNSFTLDIFHNLLPTKSLCSVSPH